MLITIRAINISMELWGCLISVLIVIYVMHGKKPLSSRTKYFVALVLVQALLLYSDAMGFLFEGDPSHFHWNVVHIANFLVFFLGYVLLLLFAHYLIACLEEFGPISRRLLYILRVVAITGMVLTIVSQFNHMYYVIDAESIYVRQDWFWLSQVLGILGLGINAIGFMKYKERLDRVRRVCFGLYFILPSAAMVIQIFSYGLALLNMVNAFCLMVIFLFVQENYARQELILSQQVSLQDQELSNNQVMLAQTRMDLMRSQIQPHFIYNTLSTIGELCLTNPLKAHEIVQEFSQYLRGNFDEMECNTPICLSSEIEHVKHYTAIEKVRFPDMQIHYDLQAEEFCLPALTIQPLVENAIKHGLMGLESGGSVVISTYETSTSYCVSVRDDGVGFDVKKPWPETGRKHLGLVNIRDRVKVMCGGSLIVESQPGCGTTALISIPKGDMV